MACHPRVVTVPFAVANAVGTCGEAWSRITCKPGILSREKVLEARCMAWTCDTHRAAEELGFVAATSLEAGPGGSLAVYKAAGWLAYAHSAAGSDRVPAGDLSPLNPGCALHLLGALEEGQERGFPILRFLNRAGISGLLPGFHAGSGERSTISVENPAAHATAGF